MPEETGAVLAVVGLELFPEFAGFAGGAADFVGGGAFVLGGDVEIGAGFAAGAGFLAGDTFRAGEGFAAGFDGLGYTFC